MPGNRLRILLIALLCTFTAYGNGNNSLGLSYSYTGAGVNYVQASGKIAYRCPTPSGYSPVQLTIAGIPTGATIVKAFLYTTTGYTGVIPSVIRDTFTTPSLTSHVVTPLNVGAGGDKNWGETGNYTTRADVTAYVTGNGIYKAAASTTNNETDGFTLLVIYSTGTGVTGNIFLYDGIIAPRTANSSSTVFLPNPVSPGNSAGFIIISDIQSNITTSIPEVTVNGTPHTIPKDFWNFEEVPISLVPAQSSVPFAVTTTNLDCYAWALAGIYYQESDTTMIIRTPFDDTILCAGDTIHVPYNVSYKFHSGNTFTVQLSDEYTNFASPVTIGSLVSDTSGTITCVIPANTVMGNGYRIRLASTSPARTSYDNGKDIGIGSAPPANVTAINNGPICAGHDLFLHGSTSTSIPELRYSWTGPAGFNATTLNPVITAPTAVNDGDYIFSARIYGCVAKDTTHVTIISLPAPTGITASYNNPLCITDTLKLSATNSTTGSVYAWTGPSFASTNQHTYKYPLSVADSGDYIVSASLNGCTVRDTIHVHLMPLPDNYSITSNSPVCSGGNFNLTASSTSTGVTYSWTGPLGFTANVYNPYLAGVTPVNAGKYYVEATLNGCKVKDSVTLVVNQLPDKPVAASNTPVCTSDTIWLNATSSTTGVHYNWTGPNSFSSAEQNPSIVNPSTSNTGDYIVTVINDTTGCIAKDTETVVIRQSPGVTANNNGPLCDGNTLNLYASPSLSGCSFVWSGPGSFFSGNQNPSVPAAPLTATGRYYVTAILNGCSGKDSTDVLIKPVPVTPVATNNSPICVDGTLNLFASSNAGSTYSWVGPGGYTSNVQNPVRTTVAPGAAGIYAVIANLNGCLSAAGTTSAVVNPVPFVTILSSPKDSICPGTPVTFTALPANTSASPMYRWLKNNITAGAGVSYTMTGINNNDKISCEITEPLKCGSPYTDTSNEIQMTVLPWITPGVSISSNVPGPVVPWQNVDFTALAVNAGKNPSYQWQRNGKDIGGAISSKWGTYQLNDQDTICVIVTSSEKCPQPKSVKSNCITVTVLTGVGNIASQNDIRLYPNPNNGIFTVKGSMIAAKADLLIINSLGQAVYKNAVNTNQGMLDEKINVQQLPAGLYLLRVIAGERTANIKFKIEE